MTYEWVVRTTERWMNLLAPLARPAFAWNHNVVMRQGGEGLARNAGQPPRGRRLSAPGRGARNVGDAITLARRNPWIPIRVERWAYFAP